MFCVRITNVLPFLIKPDKNKGEKEMKKTRLEMLKESSENAINLVLSTITGLEDTNKAIEDEEQNNNEIIASIQATNNSLSELKTNNAKIINNFKKLLQ